MKCTIPLLLLLSGLAYGQAWVQDAPMCLSAEADPQVGTLTASQWCVANGAGTAVDCTTAAPAIGALCPTCAKTDVAETITQQWQWSAGGASNATIEPGIIATLNGSSYMRLLYGELYYYDNDTRGTVRLIFPDNPAAAYQILVPAASGTVAVSATSPITLSAAGDIGCPTCITSVPAEVDPRLPTPANPADDGKVLTAATGAAAWTALPAEADAIVGNEVTNATDSTLTRSGSGTGVAPYTLGLNLANSNIWTAAQSINNSAAATIPFTIQGAATQTATLLKLVKGALATGGTSDFIGAFDVPSGTNKFRVTQDGRTLIGGVADGGAAMAFGMKAPSGSANTSFYLEAPDSTNHLYLKYTEADGGWLATDADLWLSGADEIYFKTYSGATYNTRMSISNAGLISMLGAASIDVGSNGASVPTTWASMDDGLALVNDTASASGVAIQDPPALRFEGHAWDTDTGAGPGQDDKWQWKVYPDQVSAGTTTSTMNFSVMKSPGGVDATPEVAMSLSNYGVMSIANSFTAASYIATPNTSSAGAIIVGLVSGQIWWEGATSDANETILEASDPTADRTILLPDDSGTVALNNSTRGAFTISMTSDSAAVYPGYIVIADAGTDDRFDIAPASNEMPLGVYVAATGQGVTAAGTAYSVAIGGLAYVAPCEDCTVVRSYVAYVDGTNAGTSDFSATVAGANHNAEIGHTLRTEAGYTICHTGACVNEGTETITLSGSPAWAIGDPVIYWNSGGTTITGLADGGVYFVKTISGTDVTLCATKGCGTAVNLQSDGDDSTQYLMRIPLCVLHWN